MTRFRTLAVICTMVLGAAVVMGGLAGLVAVVPQMGRDLEATQSEIQLILDSTAIALAALVLPAGALLDRWGRRRGAIWGFVGLAVALVWCTQADSYPEMLAARIATGVLAAVGFPATLAVLTSSLPKEYQRQAVAAWSAATMAGAVFALLIAGAAAEFADWTDFFYVLAGLSLLVVLGTALWVPETRDPGHGGLDPIGSLLSIVAFGGLSFGVIEMPVHGIADPTVLGALIAGVVGLIGFCVWGLTASNPLLDLTLFRNGPFAGATLLMFGLYIACFGWFYLAFQYGAYVLGWGPLMASVLLLPAAIPIVLTSYPSTSLAARIGYRPVATGAAVCTAVGMVLMGYFGDEASFWWIVPGLVLFGIGAGTCQAPTTERIVSSLPPSKHGLASGINEVSRELGCAAGLALFGALFNAAYRSDIDGSSLPPEALEVVRDNPAAGTVVAQGDPGVLGLVESAVISGWEVAFYAGAVAILVAGIVAHVLSGREPVDVTRPEESVAA